VQRRRSSRRLSRGANRSSVRQARRAQPHRPLPSWAAPGPPNRNAVVPRRDNVEGSPGANEKVNPTTSRRKLTPRLDPRNEFASDLFARRIIHVPRFDFAGQPVQWHVGRGAARIVWTHGTGTAANVTQFGSRCRRCNQSRRRTFRVWPAVPVLNASLFESRIGTLETGYETGYHSMPPSFSSAAFSHRQAVSPERSCQCLQKRSLWQWSTVSLRLTCDPTGSESVGTGIRFCGEGEQFRIG